MVNTDQFGAIAGRTIDAVGRFGDVRGGVLHGNPDADVTRSMAGFAASRRDAGTSHRKRVIEAARLYADVLSGGVDPVFVREAMTPRNEVLVGWLMQNYPKLYNREGRQMGLRETMSVTDYQALFVDVLDRMYYGYYNAFPIVNKGLVKTHQLRDFRTVSRYLLDGVVTPLTAMDPAAPAPQRALLGPDPQNGTTPNATTAPIQYSPKLYQAMTSVNWRAFVNDDLGIFRDLSQRLGIAGNRGISKFITGMYVDAAGPNASLYTTGYRNKIITANGASTNNPPLNSQGIMDAIKILAGQRDSGGDPILITGRLKLWYGPKYAAVAENLKGATSLNVTAEGGTQNADGFPSQWLQVNNWLLRDMDLVMDPYIPIVCTASGVQDTMWGLTVDPASQNRPNAEVGFLTGFETPQIFTKVGNTQRMGGGVESMLGDFNTMDQDMKIVTVMGGAQIDGRSTVASTGQGS